MAKPKQVEWVGGRFGFPASVRNPEGEQASLCLWLAPAEAQIVGQRVESEPSDAGFAASLEQALETTRQADGALPTRLRVADARLAAALPARDDVTVVVAPTPELDAAFDLLGAFLGETSYFADPALTLLGLRDFFAQAGACWEQAPWKLFDDDHVLQVDAPSLGVSGACLSVVGAGDEVLGFVLFPSHDSYARMLQESEQEASHHDALYLAFDFADELPERMVREVEEHGIPLAGGKAYPVLMRIVDGTRGAVSASDYALASSVLQGLASLAARGPDALLPFGAHTVVEALKREGDADVTLTLPHPAFDPELGRKQRARTLSATNPYGLPLEPAKLDKLRKSLRTYSLHRVIGTFCAAGSLPVVVKPNAWLSDVARSVRFANETEFAGAAESLLDVYNHVLEVLEQDDIDGLVPEADDADACREWAQGYLSLLPHVGREHMEGDAVEPIYTLHVIGEDPRIQEIFEKARGETSREDAIAQFREELADDAAFLHEIWAEARALPPAPPAPTAKSAPKVGRNDPCPCGSGKKFKKCCA